MHENSLDSYNRCKEDDRYIKLEHIVLNFFDINRNGMFTDRQVRDALRSEGKLPSGDMNDVRPKITKWKKLGVLVECGEVEDKKTQRMVRLVKWNVGSSTIPSERQEELF